MLPNKYFMEIVPRKMKPCPNHEHPAGPWTRTDKMKAFHFHVRMHTYHPWTNESPPPANTERWSRNMAGIRIPSADNAMPRRAREPRQSRWLGGGGEQQCRGLVSVHMESFKKTYINTCACVWPVRLFYIHPDKKKKLWILF